MSRLYLDHNATTPLRAEARRAMIDALDVVGNPSSVHAEGRAAVALKEQARAKIATAFGAEEAEIVFTSGATEAAAMALAGRGLDCAGVEHDCVSAWCHPVLKADRSGRVAVNAPERTALQVANSETGVIQDLPLGIAVSDAVQAAGKIAWRFDQSGAQMAFISAHKFGGPKGIGALILRRGLEVAAFLKGGGQEMGRRAGTENLIAIAGFGAAAETAARDVTLGRWEEIAEFRNILETALEAGSDGLIFVGMDEERLPNTSCVITPGWEGATQVMQMDLAGYAVSAGSACSSGKVKTSAALRSMGFSASEAGQAMRVSLGLETTKEDVLRFADAWRVKRKRHGQRAA
ncbi:MAG: aminotransferase class V-fold PLP-dependent enzyme [Pseudomonadota bacterium]